MSWLWITPRRRFRSPTTSPTWSSGVVTSTSMIGSRMTGPAFFMPSRKQALAAISKASADESTSWYLPSTRVYLKSTVGKPASTPVSACTLMPFSTAGMYSFGTAPPTTPFSNSMPVVPLLRLEDDLHLGVLARAARLLLVGVGLGVLRGDRLAVGHLRRADVGVHAVFAPQPVDDDLEVQLAHAGQDGLAGLLVGAAGAATGPRRPASAGRASSSRRPPWSSARPRCR